MTISFRLLFWCTVLLFACTTDTQHTSTAAAAGEKDGKITIPSFNKLLAATDQAQLIDVRTPSEFSSGHLDGAVNINFNDASFDTKIGQLNKSQPVFIYCQAGGRSGKAYKKMKAMGFEQVYDMEGGYGAFTK